MSEKNNQSYSGDEKKSPLTPIINQLIRKDKEINELREELFKYESRYNLKIQFLESQLEDRDSKIYILQQQHEIFIQKLQEEQQIQFDKLQKEIQMRQERLNANKKEIKKFQKENLILRKQIEILNQDSDKSQIITEEYFDLLRKYNKGQELINQLKQQLFPLRDITNFSSAGGQDQSKVSQKIQYQSQNDENNKQGFNKIVRENRDLKKQIGDKQYQ